MSVVLDARFDSLVSLGKAELKGFTRIELVPDFSTIYLAHREYGIACPPNALFGARLTFPKTYATYGVRYYMTGDGGWDKSLLYKVSDTTILEVIHAHIRNMPHRTTMYLFRYSEGAVPLPRGCPSPPELMVKGLMPELVAIAVKGN